MLSELPFPSGPAVVSISSALVFSAVLSVLAICDAVVSVLVVLACVGVLPVIVLVLDVVDIGSVKVVLV